MIVESEQGDFLASVSALGSKVIAEQPTRNLDHTSCPEQRSIDHITWFVAYYHSQQGESLLGLCCMYPRFIFILQDAQGVPCMSVSFKGGGNSNATGLPPASY